MRHSPARRIGSAFLSVIVLLTLASAQPVDPSLFSGLKWRLVGPFRGGRSVTAAGVPGNLSLYYFGAVGGGVWKSDDAGTTWQPIFDSQPIASIGAIAIAPSNPQIIYVGSGEADMRSDITYGNGMYKSVDGGRTWAHIGLEDSRQIGNVLIAPHNPDLVYVAALGHAYAANKERGVFRTTDGGKTWTAVLHPNDDTGAIDLAFDPQDSRVLYATMWQTRRPPWNVYPASNGPGSGLYKSTDGGDTWRQLKNGLPSEGLGRMGVAIAPTDHNRVYAIVDAKEGGLYRSDDAGESWKRTDDEPRIWSRGWYFGRVTVDPHNEDVVYVPNVSVYKSSDGGKSFTAFKGAPGGDDYHTVWIAPEDSQRMIISSDQGSVVTLNGGRTWSSWYNQPTAQIYHAVTDNRFPYWIYGAQQDSGAVAVPSRTHSESITEHDWSYIEAGGESGSIAHDPLHPEFLFGESVSRYDMVTGQNQDISPTIGRSGTFRSTWTLPLTISPADPHKLYFSRQMLFRTTNAGQSWEQISPDLTRENPGVPPNLDPITAGYGLDSPRKGVIYTIAPSPLDANLLWVGTDDGLIHLTNDDGKNWTNVTPAELTPWSKVGIIEASHFDRQVAYAAIDRHRLDDLRPYIYRTQDGGKSWQMIANGIPVGSYVNVVREDPKKRGLLYAGTELGVYVSFDDGADWQPMQLNLPIASVRDIVVHDNDVVVATHGRAFWVMDDIEPLREIPSALAGQGVYLFKPEIAVRTRPGTNGGTPFPPETSHGDNPENGARIDYYLNQAAQTPIALEILDTAGAVIRRYDSSEKAAPIDEKKLIFPSFWAHPQPLLSSNSGMHRFVWDMHYAAPVRNAVRTHRGTTDGPWAPPGNYIVRLTVEGKNYTQPLQLTADPRVKATPEDLQKQFSAAMACSNAQEKLAPAIAVGTSISEQVQAIELRARGNQTVERAIAEFNRRLDIVLGEPDPGYGLVVTKSNTDTSSLRYLMRGFRELQGAIESADAAPTLEQLTALQQDSATMPTSLSAWQSLLAEGVPKLNAALRSAGFAEVTTHAAPERPAH